jgi:trehalose 6-phosphate phosphatase
MKSFDLIKSKISEKSDLLLMFDYDGTLTPIKDSPELAILNKNIKNILEQIALADFIDIAIITGRQIEILKQLSGITSHNINLYGLHGGETQIKNKIINNISSTKTDNFNLFKTSIKEKLKKHNGILIEDKKHTISLHYRLSSEETAYNAIEIFKREASTFELNKDFKYQEGKKVVEILPKNFNKSRAVTAQINYCPNALPIFFGDDLTDISAFKEVKKHNGIAIGVGDLDFENSIDDRINIHDLEIFLQEIADLLKLKQ